MNKSERGTTNEPSPEEPRSDMSLAMELVKHIQEPCADKDGNNLRVFWLEHAKGVLKSDTIKNPYARQMIEEAVEEYSEK